nr:MAG TPA: hypothetical protein [Caudoviricetes sp.]
MLKRCRDHLNFWKNQKLLALLLFVIKVISLVLVPLPLTSMEFGWQSLNLVKR